MTTIPQPVKIAVSGGEKHPGLVESYAELGDRRRRGRAMGAELRPAKFHRQLAALRHIIEDYPGDVMLDGIRMRDLLADTDLNVKRLSGGGLPRHGYDRDMLLDFPVGGSDVIRKAHGLVSVMSSKLLYIRGGFYLPHS